MIKREIQKTEGSQEQREGKKKRRLITPAIQHVNGGTPAHIAAMSPGKKVDKSVDMFDLVGKWLAVLTVWGGSDDQCCLT